MKKIYFFMFLLAALCAPTALMAQSTVEIGELEGATANSYIPMNSYYKYSYSQQLYTADEIGMAGTITSITLWLYGNENLYEMPFDIYMVEVSKENFESLTDWVSVTSADIVYSGSVTVHNTSADAYTFELINPFTYSGTGNLLIAFDNNTGNWKSGLNGMTFSATDEVKRAIYARRDNDDYDPTDMSGISAYGISVDRNVIQIGITTSGTVCNGPTTVTVGDIATTSATVTWTGEGSLWNLRYKASADEDYTTVNGLTSQTYDLTGLTANTPYTVGVQTDCGSGSTSGWRYASFTTLEQCPDGFVCIGAGTSTHGYLPTATYYEHSLTQQIYTAAEIGQAGAILSIDFYCSAERTRDLSIYMVSTSKETFESNTDWIAVTAGDLVYSGEVTFAAGDWTTIAFDNPFVYNGTSNVALIVDDNTGSYESGPDFYVFNATSQALYIHADGTNYDPESPSGLEGTVLNVKNRIRLAIGEPPACPKPTGLAVSYTGGTTATVSWNSDATAWNIDVNGTVTAITENPYTLTGLDLATTYEVKVQANCGSAGLSEWTNAAIFSTDLCLPLDQCELTLELTDSYGDGWSGNAILVVDNLTSTALGEFANTNAAAAGEAQIYTLTVCNGRAIQFEWVSGNYAYEASYVVKDVNGEEIFSGSDAMSAPIDYMVDCMVTTCKKPTDFGVSNVGPHTADLKWHENGEATAWVVAWKPEGETEFVEKGVADTMFTLIDLLPETEYTVKVRPACEDAAIKWSNEITFTTTVACPKPSALNVVPSPTSATVSWTGFGESYRV